MQDEELDKLINDAASQHHPLYDDKAWGKMEHLLDKHLPQKKDRRRPFIFLLGFLLLGSAVIWGTLHSSKNNTTVAKTTNEVKPGAGPGKNFTAAVDTKTENTVTANTTTIALPKQKTNLAATGDARGVSTVRASLATLVQGQQKNKAYAFNNNNSKAYKQKARFAVKVKKPVTAYNDDAFVEEKNMPLQKSDGDDIDEAAKENAITNSPVDKIAEEKKAAAATVKTDSANNITAVKEKADIDKKTVVQQKKKKDKSFTSNFALTVAAGADVSYVSINNTGKLKPFYGAGLRYSITKHFTVASGLNVSKKVYTAVPSQYKFAAGYPNPNLVNINGECKIYEIPLTVYYTFKQVKNHNWFGAIGLSSYLMKKESYDYMYKNPTGQTWNYVKNVSNENKHYFSVLTLSGGYQYKLSNQLSFLAEPYIKLPVNNGVGLGKIKLNSAGLLFTAAVKPFAKRKK
jgi:hypothetical protein